jgi:hypothetical protein
MLDKIYIAIRLNSNYFYYYYFFWVNDGGNQIVINNKYSQDREIGRVFAEYKDKLVVIDGENNGEDKKEQCIFNFKVKSKSLRR